MRARNFSDREFRRILNDNGYKAVRTKGDHITFRNSSNRIIIMTKNMNMMIMRRLIKEYGLVV